jgi:MFS family permease
MAKKDIDVTVSAAPTWDETKRHLIPAMLVGSTLEWYDMFLYAQASALVFGTLFFTNASPLVGMVAAFATFGVGYAARPLGALLFGHIGDRYGRRIVLVTTLVIMGAATTLIGALPTYATAGIAAPILLVALRLFQGVAAGAELAGSVVMLAEVAPPARRGFWSSIPAIGVYCGIVLASLVGTVAYSLPQDDLLSWGWRVPFLVSIVLVLTGLWVRIRIGESPAFIAGARRSAPPTAEMLRTNPRRVVLAIMLVAPVATASVIVLVYSPAYSASIGTPRAVPLLGSLLGAALAIVTAPLAGHLSDRLGRRPVYIALCLATAAWAFPFFALLSTAQTWAVLVAHLVMAPAAWAITGAQAAYIAELFPTRYRLSGVALSKEICTALTAPLPVACVALAAVLGGAPWLVAGVLAASGLVGFAALLALPETRPRASSTSSTAARVIS